MKQIIKRTVWIILMVLCSVSVTATLELGWEKEYHPGDWCGYLGVTSDESGVYASPWCYSYSTSQYDFVLEKRMSSNGATIWSQRAYTDALDVYNGYLYSNDYNENTGWAWRIVKRNAANGAVIWDKTKSGSSRNHISHITVGDFGIVAIGYIDSNTLQLQRLDHDGNQLSLTQWAKQGQYSDFVADASGIYYTYPISYATNRFRMAMEKRNFNGQVIWSQTYTGPISTVPGTVAIDSNAVYFVGQERIDTVPLSGYSPDVITTKWRIQKRNLANGNLQWSVDTDPSPIDNACLHTSIGELTGSTGIDVPYDSVADSSGLYVVGVARQTGSVDCSKPQYWQIQKHDLSNGNRIAASQTDPSSQSDGATYVDVAEDSLYIVGTTKGSISGGRWSITARLEKRGSGATPPVLDIGLRVRDNGETVRIAAEPQGTVTSPLRVKKGSTTYGVVLVNANDATATGLRVKTKNGVKAIAKIQ